MLLKDYILEIFKSKCQSDAKGVHCHAHLQQDVSKVLPYLNSELGGFEYIGHPPSVTFKVHGKLITVHGTLIAVNALKSEEEAGKIIEWLKSEINAAWENKDDIVPVYKGLPKPGILEILKLLPKTNCKECNDPTCMVFASKVAEGVKGPDQCAEIQENEKSKLNQYISQFKLDR